MAGNIPNSQEKSIRVRQYVISPIREFGKRPIPLVPHTVDTRFRYSLLFTNHGDSLNPKSEYRNPKQILITKI